MGFVRWCCMGLWNNVRTVLGLMHTYLNLLQLTPVLSLHFPHFAAGWSIDGST